MGAWSHKSPIIFASWPDFITAAGDFDVVSAAKRAVFADCAVPVDMHKVCLIDRLRVS